jgi:hypothetical protein
VTESEETLVWIFLVSLIATVASAFVAWGIIKDDHEERFSGAYEDAPASYEAFVREGDYAEWRVVLPLDAITEEQVLFQVFGPNDHLLKSEAAWLWREIDSQDRKIYTDATASFGVRAESTGTYKAMISVDRPEVLKGSMEVAVDTDHQSRTPWYILMTLGLMGMGATGPGIRSMIYGEV